MDKKCKVIIVDDHDMFRAGIKVLLNSTKTIELLAEAKNGKEFIDMLPNYDPDVVLMDISMPVMDGFEATRKALERKPDLKVLALSMYGDEEYYFKMINAGVKGFILKSSGISELEKAITEIFDNHNYFSNELLRKIVVYITETKSKDNDDNKLTKREIEVLNLIAEGLSNEEIANKLNISSTTVKTHRASLLSKTLCSNTASLIMYAIKKGIISIN